MKFLITFSIFALSLSVWADGFAMSRVELNKKVAFVPHKGRGAFDNYVAMNINVDPIRALKEAVETLYRVKLLDRGEAHITLITPQEYNALSSKLSIDDLNAMAANIQNARFVAQCLGRGEKIINRVNQQAYFIVVASKNLRKYRQDVHRKFIELGGDANAFKPNDYFPHITVGYTLRDLHAPDVIKNKAACIAPLVIK